MEKREKINWVVILCSLSLGTNHIYNGTLSVESYQSMVNHVGSRFGFSSSTSTSPSVSAAGSSTGATSGCSAMTDSALGDTHRDWTKILDERGWKTLYHDEQIEFRVVCTIVGTNYRGRLLVPFGDCLIGDWCKVSSHSVEEGLQQIDYWVMGDSRSYVWWGGFCSLDKSR